MVCKTCLCYCRNYCLDVYKVNIMKDLIKKFWEKVVSILLSIPVSKYVYFILGLVLTSFLSLVFPGAIEWPAFPLIMIAVIICFIRIFFDKNPKWFNALAFSLGALLIQIFCWL